MKPSDRQLSDYWLADPDPNLTNVHDLLKLQRAVANFVKIISGRNIPVEFQYNNSRSSSDKIIISADLSDIDATVGLAIHETLSFTYTYQWCLSKVVTLLNDTYLSEQVERYSEQTPTNRYRLRNQIRREIEDIHYFIEYWRLDDYALRSSPGYKGYIQSSYRQLFDPAYQIILAEQLLPLDRFRRLTAFFLFYCQIVEREDGEFLSHPLPEAIARHPLYRELKQLIDIRNIRRLKNSEGSVKLAITVWETIHRYVPDIHPEGVIAGDEGDGTSGDEVTKIASEAESLAKELGQKAALQAPKKSISVSHKDSLSDLLSNAMPDDYYVEYENRKVRVKVIHELTSDLVFSGQYHFFEPRDTYHTETAVTDGIRLGKQLAQRLSFRNNYNESHNSRLRKGKIDKRLLHSVVCNNEHIFYEVEEETYSTVNFHLSIDGSHSMKGKCFLQSLKTAVAIAQAADIIRNINLTISFRYHSKEHNQSIPLLLIAYDSRVDRIGKIKHLFKHLKASGSTPEGLCYPAITDHILYRSDTHSENYFINLFDGMPSFIIDDDCVYEGRPAMTHTRNESIRMQKKDIRMLSYFIVSDTWKMQEVKQTFEQFKYMYGRGAQMINLDALGELANSLNQLLASSTTKRD